MEKTPVLELSDAGLVQTTEEPGPVTKKTLHVFGVYSFIKSSVVRAESIARLTECLPNTQEAPASIPDTRQARIGSVCL